MPKPQVSNRNLLIGSQFTFNVQKLNSFNHFIQSISVPGISTGPVEVSTPFSSYYEPGDHINYENLSVTFTLSESLENYFEVFSWMTGLGFPESYDQYKDLKMGIDKDLEGNLLNKIPVPSKTRGNTVSDAILLINTSHNNSYLRFDFIDLFPISLSSFDLSYKNTETEYLTQTVTFRYDRFTLNRV